jgi:hypothetical protein
MSAAAIWTEFPVRARAGSRIRDGLRAHVRLRLDRSLLGLPAETTGGVPDPGS